MSYCKNIELTKKEQKLRNKLVSMLLSVDYANMLLAIELLKAESSNLRMATVGRLFRIMYYLAHHEDDQPDKTYGYKFKDAPQGVNYKGMHIGHWEMHYIDYDEIDVFLSHPSSKMAIVFRSYHHLSDEELDGRGDWELVDRICVSLGGGRCIVTYNSEGKNAELVCDDFIAALEADIRNAMGKKTI